MNDAVYRTGHSPWALLLRTLAATACIVMAPAGFSGDDMWQVLAADGNTLDIMGLEPISDGLRIYGAQYVEQLVKSPGERGAEATLSTMVRKQLYVMRIDHDERVRWRHVYAALPDVQEIFSANAARDGSLCIVFGERHLSQGVLDPVLVQLDAGGKILWARRNLTDVQDTSGTAKSTLEQIANLDTLRVVATPDNGCMLSFVSRVVNAEAERFYLHLIHHARDGIPRWRHKTQTSLFGRMFLVNDANNGYYVVVLTNQSRDAAIQAMVEGAAFNPQTTILGISHAGEVLYRVESPKSLAMVWVNAVANAQDDHILLAGKTQSAWAGYIDRDGRVAQRFEGPPGEFNAVGVKTQGGYLFARGSMVQEADEKLRPGRSMQINRLVTRRYTNRYLAARLPDDISVQQIVAWKPAEYLLLYKLGSRLLKINTSAARDSNR